MKQGHAYEWRGMNVLALESGEEGIVGVIVGDWFSDRRYVRAKDLVPMPMAYFHGTIPT